MGSVTVKVVTKVVWGCRGWGWQAAGTWVLVSVKWWDFPPPPHWVTWSQPINIHPVKSQRAPKFEQKPALFVPIELL